MKREDVVTKKDYFTEIITMFGNMDGTAEFFTKGETIITYSDVVAFFEKEVALLNKKASYKSTKPTKTQEANEVIKEKILEVLRENGGKMTIKEMWGSSEELATITDRSTSKMSALLTQLREDGKIIRTYDKKVAYFSIA